MDPSRKGAASATKVSDLPARDVQRQTVPVDGEDDDQRQQQNDAPPPYEPSPTGGSTSTSANPGISVFTPPSSSRPSVRELGDVNESRSSCSSFGEDDTAGLLAGNRGRKGGAGEEGYMLTPRPRLSQDRQEGGEGYTWTDPMSVEAGDRWESLKDTPGCCFSDSGGCCFSKRGGCCFSDRGGCCCSDTTGCCFSSDGACCFSGSGGRPQL
ncbi:hypothetical protein ColTof3_13602 [Colletotrichum tofieldiae]|nr:hypothetical protein ColTof3_13602 [Colletotrichum tofieldiae]